MFALCIATDVLGEKKYIGAVCLRHILFLRTHIRNK